MKKLLLLAAVSALGFTAKAQTEKGKLVLGGNFSFGKVKNEQYDLQENSKSTSFNISPSIGYFVADNLAVGTEIGYFYSKYNQVFVFNGALYSNDHYKQHAYVISPYARYYTNVTGQIKFFGHLSVPIYRDSRKSRSDTDADYGDSSTYDNFGVSLSPGFVFFPNPRLGIEFSVNGISYNATNYKDEVNDSSDYKTKSFNIGLNLTSPNIGVQYYF